MKMNITFELKKKMKSYHGKNKIVAGSNGSTSHRVCPGVPPRPHPHLLEIIPPLLISSGYATEIRPTDLLTAALNSCP